jgi:hypothetical protein
VLSRQALISPDPAFFRTGAVTALRGAANYAEMKLAFTSSAAAAVALLAPAAFAQPVVVELFQSQGCSSCPPANANLAAIAGRPDVIALNFSVTYWDNLGWKDTFATPGFTARQWDYAHAFHRTQVFTPQVVVDGRRDGSGIQAADFVKLVGQGSAGAPSPTLAFSAKSVSIGNGARPPKTADVWLVRYDPRTLNVPVRAGENHGKTLPHKDIVRELTRLGGWSGAAETLRLPAPAERGLTDVVLVQLPKGGPILAAIRG